MRSSKSNTPSLTTDWAARLPHYFWTVALFSCTLLLVLLVSIQSSPAQAQRRTGRSSTDLTAGVSTSPGELLLRSQLRLRLLDPDDILIGSLAYREPLQQRLAAMSRLVQRGHTDVLISALASRDQGIRVGAIQVLGWQRASSAVQPLVRASYDPDPRIREAALNALGETGSWLALPRLQQARVVEVGYYVQQAAYLAEQKINRILADELGIGLSELQAVAVASDTGSVYAVTSQGLYARGAGSWRQLRNIPDVMTGVIATSPDANTIYLGTISGLFRSVDGGGTWESVPTPRPGKPDIRVTAVLVDSLSPYQVFIAIASAVPTMPAVATPLGIYVSSDGAHSWTVLPDSPRDYMTTRLGLDTRDPRYLFGATGVGTWRYTLSESTIGI